MASRKSAGVAGKSRDDQVGGAGTNRHSLFLL